MSNNNGAITEKRKPGRPRQHGARARTELQIPPDLLQQVRQAARDRSESVSTYICSLLTAHIKHQLPYSNSSMQPERATAGSQQTPIAIGNTA
jgi:hypothetical protein